MVLYVGFNKSPLHNLTSLPPYKFSVFLPVFPNRTSMAGPPFDHNGVNTTTATTTIKFLCSYGGKILPRHSDSKLRYVGGHTRVLAVDCSVSFSELLLKLEALCGTAVSLKCQLPTEDLDALVSVKSDEDLAHLIEEYNHGGSSRPSLKIRAFILVPRSGHQERTSPPSSDTSSPQSLSPRSSPSSSSFSSTSAVGSTSSSRFSTDNRCVRHSSATACTARPARKVARYAYDHHGNPSTIYLVPSDSYYQ